MTPETIILKLSNGEAMIDYNDWCEVKGYTWRIDKRGYVVRSTRSRALGLAFTFRLHREIMKAPKGVEVDHKNGNKLDNRKSNLRFATKPQNQWNSKMRINNTSGFKGVSFEKAKGKYAARIRVGSKYFRCGYFCTAIEAAAAYDAAATHYFGEFARTNKTLLSQ